MVHPDFVVSQAGQSGSPTLYVLTAEVFGCLCPECGQREVETLAWSADDSELWEFWDRMYTYTYGGRTFKKITKRSSTKYLDGSEEIIPVPHVRSI